MIALLLLLALVVLVVLAVTRRISPALAVVLGLMLAALWLVLGHGLGDPR